MSMPALSSRTRATRIAREASQKAPLSVVPRSRTRAPRMLFFSLVSFILVAGVVGLLLFNTSMQQASFTTSQLETQAELLTGREQTLRMELDQLRDPQRVALQAQRMGMVIPPAPVFLDLTTGATSGVRVPATRADAIGLLPKAPVKPAVLAPPPTVVEVPAPPAADAASSATDSETTKNKAKNKDRGAAKSSNRNN